MSEEMEFEFIDEKDMVFVPRGRKSNLPDSFVNKLKEQIKKNNSVALKQFVLITEMSIPKELTDGKEIKNYKAKVSATLRGLAKRLGYGSQIHWHKETIPAIRFSTLKK